MMASFMRYYRRTKATFTVFLRFLFLSFCLISVAWAAAGSLHIKTAELTGTEEAYLLNADFEVNFSSEVEEALNKGVPLNFLIEFQIVSPQKYWFDDEIVTRSSHISLSYHALSRQYLINRNNHQQSFSSLQEAKDDLAHLRDWQVVEKSMLKKGESYHAALRIRLDQSKLPKPLQVEALSSEDWNMVSERYRWTPAISF
jgi:hypothetical protein